MYSRVWHLLNVFIKDPDDRLDCTQSTVVLWYKTGKGGWHHSIATLRHRRNEPIGVPWNSAKGNAKSCTWQEVKPRYKCIWEANWMQSSSAEKDTEALMDTKLNVSQQCDFAAKIVHKFLGCTRNTTASMPRQVIHLLSFDKPALGFPVQERHEYTEASPVHHECDERLGHVTQKERLSRLALFSWKRRLGPKYLKTFDRRMKTRLLLVSLVVSSERTRANKHKMKYRKCHFKHKKIKNLWTTSVVEHWNRVAWRDCGVLLLEDTQNPTGQGPEPAALIDCTLSSRFRLDDLKRTVPIPQKFYDPMKINIFKHWACIGLIYFKCVFV